MSSTQAGAQEQGDPLAAISKRMGARVIDWLLLLMVMVPVTLIVIGNDPDVDPPTWIILGSILLPFVYETVMVAWRGQTIGKMIAGIEIVLSSSRSTPPLLNAALRAVPALVIMALLGQLALLVLVVVYFSAGFMNHNRGILDRLASTVVIEARR